MTWIDTPTTPAIPAALEKNSATRQRKSAEITEELPSLGGPPAQAVPAPQNPFSKRPLAGLVQPVLPTKPCRTQDGTEESKEMQTKSKAMADVMVLGKRYAEDGDGAIMLRGETGVGKSHIAERLAKWTGRKGAFVTVCCGAIPASLIESQLFGHVRGAFSGAVSNHVGAFKRADGGVIFLDEVGELPLDMQVKLLRVTQDGTFCPVGGSADVTVNVRIIAATNRDLGALVKAGKFREDLMFRLEALPLTIPPLRERRGEIKGLVEGVLEGKGWVLNEGVLEVFEFAEWPGNIRELLNTVQRAALAGWTAKDAAQEVYRPDTKATPTAGRAGRLAVARDLSEQGWWSVAELTLATGAAKATICRDLLEWAEAGEIESKGEGNARRHRVQSQESHETNETETKGTESKGEVVK